MLEKFRPTGVPLDRITPTETQAASGAGRGPEQSGRTGRSHAESAGPDAQGTGMATPAAVGDATKARGSIGLGDRIARFIASVWEFSIGRLLMTWLWMILGFGFLYWIGGIVTARGLIAGGRLLGGSLSDLGTAVYFSFVTALSIGYGDVTPLGVLRALAVVEGAAGLLIFGVVISKLVSRRQEVLTEEIHRLAFEDRLGRVRTNLHLVLAELQSVAVQCSTPGAQPERLWVRVESAAAVFTGELRTIHDLLYRPQQAPGEQALESILASLAEGLREIGELQRCSAALAQSAAFRSTLRSIATLSNEICGECVPRDYAPHLRTWMDRIQELARSLR